MSNEKDAWPAVNLGFERSGHPYIVSASDAQEIGDGKDGPVQPPLGGHPEAGLRREGAGEEEQEMQDKDPGVMAAVSGAI